jgi:hypothetical protein
MNVRDAWCVSTPITLRTRPNQQCLFVEDGSCEFWLVTSSGSELGVPHPPAGTFAMELPVVDLTFPVVSQENRVRWAAESASVGDGARARRLGATP